jgi:hypothetical protein
MPNNSDTEPYGGRKITPAGKETKPSTGVLLTDQDFARATDVLGKFAWVGLMETMGTR